MELLGEFFEKDRDIIQNPEEEVCYKVRKAARAVVWNRTHELALIYVSRHGYHKLPGGGVERGENLAAALRRELKEEIGADVRIDGEVGATIEYRDTYGLLQISYCYIAELIGEAGALALTDEEKARGFELEWTSIGHAINTLENDAPADDVGHFIRLRDLTFLRRVQEREEEEFH
jgi:8-oxo-dGTP diphosphatase